MLSIHTAILLPFIAALLMLIFVKSNVRSQIGWFVLIVPTILFIFLLTKVPEIANGSTFSGIINWIPSFDINFSAYLDGLSMVFGLLISGIGILVVLYSIYYLSTEKSVKHFYIYLLMFMGSMLGVVFSDHLLMLYVFWELTSISSFLLIAFWYQRKGSRAGAMKALLITVLGGFSMLAGFLMLYVITGTFNIREIIANVDIVKEHSLLTPMMILILLGAFTKSAQFPFHIWLPDAMEAPTPVSAYLHSATMVKAGIYLVARFTPVFGGEAIWFWLVSVIGLTTLFWASFNAIRQTDLKALLAYSTVSQLGLIMSLFGVGSLSLHPDFNVQTVLYTQAVFAALFHLVNHSTFKGALFMVIGIIDYKMGTRDLRRLGGLITIMPFSFTVALIGSFSMAGLPPFNGFLSKEMFFTAMLNVKQFDFFSIQTFAGLFPVVAWIASVFTFMYCMLLLFQSFFGPYKEIPNAHAEEASFGMLIAPLTLASLIILIFIFPNVLGDYVLKPAVHSIYPNITNDLIADIQLWHGFNTELMMTIGIVIVGTLLYIFRDYFKKVFTLFPRSISFNSIYHFLLDFTDRFSNTITNLYMTGYLRHYLMYIFVIFVLLLGGTLIYLDAFEFTLVEDQPLGIFSLLIALSIVVAAIAVLFVKSRLSAIVIVGYIGFAVATFFVILRAPDLALTQLVVETVTTALFLLCFYFLPKWKQHHTDRKLNITNLIIALSVGVTFTLTALSVKSGRLFDSISSYFEKSDELAGGKNIVNTILGDFRAFDTMLEVIVLFIAGIGVYTLVKYRDSKGGKEIED